MKEFNTLEKAKLISNEIKKKLEYNSEIEIFDNDKHIVTFYCSSLFSYEIEKLIEIKNEFNNNFQLYAEKTSLIEIVFIVKPKPTK